MDLTPKKLTTLLLSMIVGAVCLTEVYLLFGRFIEEQWMAAAFVNSTVAAFILVYFLSKKTTRVTENELAVFERVVKIIGRKQWVYFIPGLAILLGALILVFISSAGNPAKPDLLSSELMVYILFVIWIPPIEEIVFRRGVGNWMRKNGGMLWGSYFSALLFSLVHSNPSLQNIMQLKIGFPLGPLLLGVSNEFLYLISGKKVMPIIFLHASCNATTLIFLFGDSRWLEWLGFLFLK